MPLVFAQRIASAREVYRNQQSLTWTLSSLRALYTDIWPDDDYCLRRNKSNELKRRRFTKGLKLITSNTPHT